MNDANPNPYSRHDEIVLLLPWFVNKTLDDAETKAVEHHLKVCLVCNREIAKLQRLSLAVKQADAPEASSAQASFSRLQARIHGPARMAAAGLHKQVKPERRRFNIAFPTFSYRIAAALLLGFLLIPGYLFVDGAKKQPENRYRTLASSEIIPARNDQIRVAFSDSTDSGQKTSLIGSIAGEIVEGPNAMGVYLIRLKQGSDPQQVLETLTTLRKNPEVVFAEPAFSLSAAVTEQEPR
jgi:hypothetical protein